MSKDLTHLTSEPLFGDEYWTEHDSLFCDPPAQFVSSDDSASSPYTVNTSPQQSSSSSFRPSMIDPHTSSPDSMSHIVGASTAVWYDQPSSWLGQTISQMDHTKTEPADARYSPEDGVDEAADGMTENYDGMGSGAIEGGHSHSLGLYSSHYEAPQTQTYGQMYSQTPMYSSNSLLPQSTSTPIFSPPSYIGAAAVSKKEERKIRNRLSAQRSRQKKEEQLLDYKGKSEYFEDQCRRLQIENDRLRHENHILRSENDKLRGSGSFSITTSATASASASACGNLSSSNSSPALAPPSLQSFATDSTLPISSPSVAANVAKIPSFSISQLLSGTNRGALLMVVLSVGLMLNMVASPYGPSLDPKAITPANGGSSIGFRSRQILHINEPSTIHVDDANIRNDGLLGKGISAEFGVPEYGSLVDGADTILHLRGDASESSMHADSTSADADLDCKQDAQCRTKIHGLDSTHEEISAL